MTRRVLMMSAKKRAEIKKKEIAYKAQEEKERKDLLKPLFAKVKKTNIILPKLENCRAPGTKHIASFSANLDFSNATAKKESTFYTGDNLIGIAVAHKSCLVPVFSTEQAQDIAKMRRG